MNRRDRELGMGRRISRRDFLNGMAAATLLSSGRLRATQPDPGATPYPPALTGMRGSHPGSFEVAHALRDGRFWRDAGSAVPVGERFDLIVVGGGISGLAAAYFYRQRAGRRARILILDNHDDFGGHARRNEFRVGDRTLIAYGGTESIETPTLYSREARRLLAALGIEPRRLARKANDQTLYAGLRDAVFFDRETFGADHLAVGIGERPYGELLAAAPLSAAARRDIVRIEESPIDYLPGLSSAEKKDRLSRVSYRDFLLQIANARPEVLPYYQTRTHDYYGVGIDAVPALDCWAMELPGFQGLALAPGPAPRMSATAAGVAGMRDEDFEFHYPDGNASVARLLVRALIPGAVPGRTAEDIVTARIAYAALDQADAPVRLRLNSTVVKAANVAGDGGVEVQYVAGGQLQAVRGNACVLACWNMVIPYLCPELPAEQRAALAYGVKVPLVYTNVALRDWTAFARLGIRHIAVPGGYHSSVGLIPPVSLGGYRHARSAAEPTVLHLLRTPCRPGLSAREQQRSGHVELLTTPFATFERHLRDELGRMLGAGGFDPARDIAGITVNRWPHGYAYEYNPLFDPEWAPDEQPCVIGRRRFGRIAIANSDAAAYAYTDAAIDQAFRAIAELAGK